MLRQQSTLLNTSFNRHHIHAFLPIDSKPFVQAYESEFQLVHVSRHCYLTLVVFIHRSDQHIAGAFIFPLEFASQNALNCEDFACQIYNFINQVQSSVVFHVIAADSLLGKTSLPFTSRTAWFSVQSDCADLPCTHAHLIQVTRLPKQTTNATDVNICLLFFSIYQETKKMGSKGVRATDRYCCSQRLSA